jgi:hypothetical protein
MGLRRAGDHHRPFVPGLEHPGSRVRNGQIVASRDYHNHLVLAEVLGQLPMLLTALANEEPT